ncbi:MAG: hypothetical protein RIS76_3760 [Verrucomicrobiota bacterium]
MRFEFASAGKILFGPGRLAEIGPLAREHGRRALVVTGREARRAEALCRHLSDAGVDWVNAVIPGEPSVADAVAGTGRIRAERIDLVIGFGGGSVLDGAKAMAALATNPGDPYDYLEVIGRGGSLSSDPLPFIAIPTTAGTGAEVTRNAVLGSPENRVKVSLGSPRMLPRIALVDPELCRSVSPEVTATTGLDALTQLLEAFVSVRATPFTDALCRDALPRVGRSLHRAWRNGQDLGARCEMSLAALSSGLALANAGLGVVHGFAGPLGGMTGAAHGALCSALLEPVTRVNLAALRQRMPASPAIERYAEAMRLLGGPDSMHPEAFPDFLAEWTHPFALSDLAALGTHADDFVPLLPRVLAASSTRGNPIELTNHELDRVFQAAMGSGQRPPPPSRETPAGVRDVGEAVR